MARFETHLDWSPLEAAQRGALISQLAEAMGTEATWLDANNASLPLVLQPLGLAVQVLLEFQHRGPLVVLVNSREGMGQGAPQTRQVLVQLLQALTTLAPATKELYRSDRDGPIRVPVAA